MTRDFIGVVSLLTMMKFSLFGLYGLRKGNTQLVLVSAGFCALFGAIAALMYVASGVV